MGTTARNSMAAALLGVLLAQAGAYAADYSTTIAGFWTALVAGDTATLRTYYNDPVTLQAGSELLDREWGIYADSNQIIVTVNDTSSIDSVTVTTVTDTIWSYRSPVSMDVPRGVLLSALTALVDSTGLVEWQAQFSGLAPAAFSVDISGLPTTVEVAVPMSAAGFVGDDTLQFVLHSSDGGMYWTVTSEQTDY
jgi:hypothetical protein